MQTFFKLIAGGKGAQPPSIALGVRCRMSCARRPVPTPLCPTGRMPLVGLLRRSRRQLRSAFSFAPPGTVGKKCSGTAHLLTPRLTAPPNKWLGSWFIKDVGRFTNEKTHALLHI